MHQSKHFYFHENLPPTPLPMNPMLLLSNRLAEEQKQRDGMKGDGARAAQRASRLRAAHTIPCESQKELCQIFRQGNN
jgi:hypothetical protein